MNTPAAETAPGFRFSRIGSSNEPQHLIDIWLLAEPARISDYAEHPEPYRTFRAGIDREFGSRTRFTFVGEIDTREDLGGGNRLGELLNSLEIGFYPAAASTPLAVSVHRVPRWGNYCLLLSGWASNRTDWGGVKAYVVRRVGRIDGPGVY